MNSSPSTSRLGRLCRRFTFMMAAIVLPCCSPGWKIVAISKAPLGPTVVCEEKRGYESQFRAKAILGSNILALQPPVRGFAQRLAVIRSPDGRDFAVLACLRQGDGPSFKGYSGHYKRIMTDSELASFFYESILAKLIAAGRTVNREIATDPRMLAIEACDALPEIPGEVRLFP